MRGRPCYRQEGCAIHWKRRQRVPCLECGKPTASKYSLCNLHADKCHAKAFYYRNKLSKNGTERANNRIFDTDPR